MRIVIETIPHKLQNYVTVGDWRRDSDGTLRIKVSEEIGDEYSALVAIHELVELLLCEKRGITCEQVDDFDKQFEAQRPKGDNSEPGDNPTAPYYKEHQVAGIVERILAHELGVHWPNYEDAINALP